MHFAEKRLLAGGNRTCGARCKRAARAVHETGAALGTLVLLGTSAWADSAHAALPAPPPTFSFADLFAPSRTTLLGDAGGIRPALAKYGITFTLFEESEVFGNVTGGYKRGADYDGVTTPTVMLDTSKAFGWEGGTFEVSGFQIHGSNLSAKNLGALQLVSGLEADDSTRLWELWYQQTLGKTGWDVKIGQQSLDNEFITSTTSLLFLNTSMGWPLVPSEDMYAGGPAYPLSSLGVRLHGQIVPNVTALLGVFDDNPPGGPFNDDSQLRGPEANGVRFNLNTGALVIGELQYALNPPPTDPKSKGHGSSWHVQAWLLVRHGLVPGSAVRHRWSVAGEPGEQRRCRDAPRQLQLLWHRRSGHLAARSFRAARAQRLYPRDGHTAGRSQSHHLQRQWRPRAQSAVQGTRRRYRRPRFRLRFDLGQYARLRCRHRGLCAGRDAIASPQFGSVPRDLLHDQSRDLVADHARFPIRLQSRRRSREPDDPNQLVHDEAVFGVRTTIAF